MAKRSAKHFMSSFAFGLLLSAIAGVMVFILLQGAFRPPTVPANVNIPITSPPHCPNLKVGQPLPIDGITGYVKKNAERRTWSVPVSALLSEAPRHQGLGQYTTSAIKTL